MAGAFMSPSGLNLDGFDIVRTNWNYSGSAGTGTVPVIQTQIDGTYDLCFNVYLGTTSNDNNKYMYFTVPTGVSTYMDTIMVEAWQGNWSYTTGTGYKRWVIRAVANVWTVVLAEDQSQGSLSAMTLSAIPNGTTNCRIGVSASNGNSTIFRIKSYQGRLHPNNSPMVFSSTNPF